MVRLFTDGACSGNPGPGGWAFILVHPASGHTIEASGAEPHTTNNRMELAGVIEGLAILGVVPGSGAVADSRSPPRDRRMAANLEAQERRNEEAARSSPCQTWTFGRKLTHFWKRTAFG